MTMRKVAALFGPMRALAAIKPPGRSLDDWERFLRQASEVALHAPGKAELGPLGISLIERAKWLKHAQANSYTWLKAERAWDEAHGVAPSGLGAPEETYEGAAARARDLGL